MRLGTELKDGGNEPVRSLSRFLPTRRPDDNSINALVYDSDGGDDGDEGNAKVLRRANTQQKARHALQRCVQARKKFQQGNTENSDIKMEDGGLKFYICGNICFVK